MSFKRLDQETQALAADVTSWLDRSDVPNLLFGRLPMRMVGYNCNPSPDVDFVIPNSKMPSAIAALVAAGYLQCTDITCRQLDVIRSNGTGIMFTDANDTAYDIPHHGHAVPAAHFHVGLNLYTLSLYMQSAMLWWLPELQTGPPAADDSHLMLSKDTRLPPCSDKGGRGPWLSDSHPVKILNASSIVQAIMMLYCRDNARGKHDLCSLWMHTIIALKRSRVCETQDLKPKFQYAWEYFKWRRPIESLAQFRLLRDRLILDNELGPLFDANTYFEVKSSCTCFPGGCPHKAGYVEYLQKLAPFFVTDNILCH